MSTIRRLGLSTLGVLGLCLGVAPSASAQATAPASRSAPDLAMDAARAAYESLPDIDRRAIQDALIWSGHYSGVADGTFGRQTFEALLAYQQRNKLQPNSVLSPPARTALLASAQQARMAAGFSEVEDPKTGVRIGVPSQVLPKQDINQNGGSRWQSADGKVTLDTRLAPPDATLQSLFDRNVAIQTPGRVLTYKIIRPDFFVIAGETPTGKFYTRYASSAVGIRAFSIGYDKALAAKMDPLVVAIANSFVPFPSAAVPVATAPQASVQSAVRPAATTGTHIIGTGLTITKRQILAGVDVVVCKDPRAGGVKPQQISGTGPWLWEFGEDLKATPARFASARIVDGGTLLVIGFSAESEQPRLDAIPAVAIGETAISAPLQPGASGAPVFDQAGSLVGFVGPIATNGRRIAGILPATHYALVLPTRAKEVADTLSLQPVSSTAHKHAAEIVSAIKPALVPIQCAP